MEVKTIVAAIISITVACVVVMSLLVPMIEVSNSDMTTTYTQPEKAVPMALDENATFEGTITATGGNVTIGDKTYAMPDYTTIFLLTDKFIFYTAVGGVVFVNFWDETAQKGISYGGGSTLTITISDKDASISYISAENVEYTVSEEGLSWIAYRDDAGDYYSGFFAENTNQKAYYQNVEQIRSVNYIATTNGWFSMIGTDVLVNMTDEVTATNTATADSNGVYTLDISRTAGDITFEVDNNGTPYTVHPWVWLIPGDFIVVNTESKEVYPLINIIPVITLIGILVGAVAMVISKR